MGRFLRTLAILSLMIFSAYALASADQIPAGWKASNMRAIGYSDLNGHGGFKMAIKHVGDKWYLYMGHLWETDWTIVDVTDATNPKVVKNWNIGDNSGSAQMELQGNLMLTSLQGIPWGWDKTKPHQEGVAFWDISDPVNPKLLSKWLTAGGTHRNTYPGGKYAYLAAHEEGYNGQIFLVMDVSDPVHPKIAGRWWMQGQKEGETAPPSLVSEVAPPGGHGATPSLHGGITFENNVAYVAYGPALVLLDVKDPTHPKQISRLDFSPPFNGILMHDALKIPGKPYVFVHAEALGGDTTPDSPYRRSDDLPACAFSVPLVAMVDVTDQTHPRFMSMFPLPQPPKGEPYTDFCDKGGRFGPHNTNLLQHNPDVEKQADLIYLTYFNAGLRIFNIEDPRNPKEVGYFIPPQPTKRIGPVPAKLTTSTEDVLVDTRGNIYITDKQWGLFVLKYTGEDEPKPTAK
jgi:hypothetical protein